MGRPRIEWDDAQLRAIMGALAGLDRNFLLNSVRFLDGLVAAVRAITGRVYGATTYGRLLRDVAPQAGVTRRPSTPTIQAAVLRAHALAPVASRFTSRFVPTARDAMRAAAAQGDVGGAGEGSGLPVAVDTDALRGALAPLVRDLLRDSLAPVHALLAQPRRSAAAGDGEGRQLRLTTAALEDGHARIRQLEKEMGETAAEAGRRAGRARPRG
ncbi:hypothetical protein [Paraburkholderia diazotrophica]|uniref:hypothetical protein n=1 Tax=Paraburkholderia diazotrophica TaxID=667676 RepID=UPI00317B7A76